MNRRVLAALALLALVATGCSGSGDDTAVDTSADPAPRGDGPAAPQGAGDVVLRIETAGGYVPVDHAFATVPTVLVTGDGTVIRPDEQAADASRPRLLPLVQHTVDADVLQELLDRADELGLLAEPPDYAEGAPMVTDMGSTTVTVSADGDTWVHSAYALGFEEEQGKRKALAEFVDDATDLVDGGDTEPYEPAAVRLFATAAEAGDYPVVADFPEAVDLTAAGECLVVDDPAVAADVVEAMTGSPDDALFRQGGRTFSVTAAAVLPGDGNPCADR